MFSTPFVSIGDAQPFYHSLVLSKSIEGNKELRPDLTSSFPQGISQGEALLFGMAESHVPLKAPRTLYILNK